MVYQLLCFKHLIFGLRNCQLPSTCQFDANIVAQGREIVRTYSGGVGLGSRSP